MDTFDDSSETPPDFDVHNDSRNLAGASPILNFLCFITVIVGSYTMFGILAIIVLLAAFPVLIVTKSTVIKRLALSALLGVAAAVALAWIPGMMKY